MNIEIDDDAVGKLIDGLDDLEKRQIPFAESRAVNFLGYTIQRDTINRVLPEKFQLRTDWWRPGTRTGVNYFPSNKKQFPNIFSRVNTLAWFMEMQETGGTKRPKPGEAYVPVPTWNAQPTHSEVIRSSRRYKSLTLRPGTVINQKTGARSRGAGSVRTLAHQGNPWVSTLKNGQPSIAVRLTTDRVPVAVMYIGKDSISIKPRFGFVDNAKRIVNEMYLEVFERELNHAIATALEK